uniref:Uncharacterized protein n=1 Tax=Arundo donax TaxID=35708 RepID=A0A0A8Y052_ARUDO
MGRLLPSLATYEVLESIHTNLHNFDH